MTRFHCIGGDCEASCCTGGWKIPVDREHYDKAKSAMGSRPASRQEFDAKVTRVKGVARTDRSYALMVLQNDGSCSFLGADRLCSLQQRFGEAVLSDTCTIYPRALAISGTRRELSGVTSCPEVARQLLLHEDAMDLVEVTPALVGRERPHVSLNAHPSKPYVRYHDELRNLMLDLLSDNTYPLRSRLSFVAYFASRTAGFLHGDASTLDEGRLLAEVERAQDLGIRSELHLQFGQLPVEPAFAAWVVHALVDARSPVEGFRQLIEAVIRQYSQDTSHAVPATSAAFVQTIVQGYLQRKELWQPFAPRIDRYFENYAKNYWAREWYLNSPNLLAHTTLLLARIATLRFLLLGHPLLASALAEGDAEKESALDRAVVTTVQKFSRAFEHDSAFTARLQDKLAAANLITLAHATCLAAF